MGNLGDIFTGGFKAPKAGKVDLPERQFEDAMIQAGLDAPDDIIGDGRIHRFRTESAKGRSDKSGWYVLYSTGVPAGRFGCFRQGFDEKFVADMGREISQEERMAHIRLMEQAKKARDEEKAKAYDSAAKVVSEIWDGLSPANGDHPYLKNKGVGAHGVRVTGDGRLALPLYNTEGTLNSLQYIDSNGGKQFHPGGKASDSFWILGDPSNAKVCYVAEGFATAATIYQETGFACFISFSAGSLMATCRAAVDFSGSHKVVVVGDNDTSGTGQRKATEAGQALGIEVIIPPQEGDVNDYRVAGGDVRALLQPKNEEWLVQADDFCAQPSPIKWLVKGWLQDEALIMIHGPSGSGKTFLVLDMCCRIAGNVPEWSGKKVSHGNVVYLAGEGHHGLRGRIAAWKQHNSVEKLDMWLSKAGCDLNTPTGYSKVITSIKSLKEKPSIIVVDTLHRFLDGDENSSVDAKSMLDACAGLMAEFQCSVLLVHHTGVSGAAQSRARGSSAWRGALDIEINVAPSTPKKPIEVKQMKSKDAEEEKPLFFTLESVAIDGWFGEDENAVTSAVFEPANGPSAEDQAESATARRSFEGAWRASGKMKKDELPFVSRDDLKAHLASEGMSEDSIERTMRPGGKVIGSLLGDEMIQKRGNSGWIICSSEWFSVLNLIG